MYNDISIRFCGISYAYRRFHYMRIRLICLISCVSILLLAGTAYPQFVLERNFFGIPGMEELSDEWLIEESDSTDFGFTYPVDIEIIRLSPTDYRIVVIDAIPPYFTQFQIDLQNGVSYADIVKSGLTQDIPFSMITKSACLVKTGHFFDPATDRIALADYQGNRIALFSFIPETGVFEFDTFVAENTVNTPIGVYWGAENYYIVEEANQRIVRLTSEGQIVSTYGYYGMSPAAFQRISDVAAFTDSSNVVHLYLCDGGNSRVDHLVADQLNEDIYLHSQIWCQDEDTLYLTPSKVVALPGVGVVAYDQIDHRLMCWIGFDSLHQAERFDAMTDSGFVDGFISQIRQAGGRLVVLSYDEAGNFAMTSWGVNSYLDNTFGSIFDDPEPSPPIPGAFRLHQNFPNPFNPTTEIRFDLPDDLHVKVSIYNVLGQEIATLVDWDLPAGIHSYSWSGRTSSGFSASTGMYLYRIIAGGHVDTKKMVLLR